MPEINARGLRFHVQRLSPKSGVGAATRPLVVFLHGLVMDNLSSLYFTLAGGVAEVADVLLYDLRGHGLSERPASGYGLMDMVADLDAILAELAVTRPLILVSNSFGGVLALAFAAASPARVAGLAIIEGQVGEPGWAARMAATIERTFGDAPPAADAAPMERHVRAPGWAARVLADIARTGETRDRLVAASFGEWLKRHGEQRATRLARSATALVYETSLKRDLLASPALDRAALGRIACPVLALYGAGSDLRAEAERAASALPACELSIVEGASHALLWEQTERVRRDVLGLIARASAGRASAWGG
jgi:pimeloyl-ACP methyl ester carboxylesterase